MKNINRDEVYIGQKVIYRCPIAKDYYYTYIKAFSKHSAVIALDKGALSVWFNQLYYNNPENKTEALLRGINIRPKSQL